MPRKKIDLTGPMSDEKGQELIEMLMAGSSWHQTMNWLDQIEEDARHNINAPDRPKTNHGEKILKLVERGRRALKNSTADIAFCVSKINDLRAEEIASFNATNRAKEAAGIRKKPHRVIERICRDLGSKDWGRLMEVFREDLNENSVEGLWFLRNHPEEPIQFEITKVDPGKYEDQKKIYYRLDGKENSTTFHNLRYKILPKLSLKK